MTDTTAAGTPRTPLTDRDISQFEIEDHQYVQDITTSSPR
jgi:hypothetical protein